MHAAEPIHDDDLVLLANALAGLRRELASSGVEIGSQVDVDPTQPYGPWHPVVEAVRAGVATLDDTAAGALLERAVPAAGPLADVLPVAGAAAADAGRGQAFDRAVEAAVEDAAALAARIGHGQPDLVLAIEAAYAAALGACYGTWVVRDLVDLRTVAAGIGLVNAALQPLDALAKLQASGHAAAVLDVAGTLPADVWARLAAEVRARSDVEAMASVRLRAIAAVTGYGGAEVAVVAALAPAGTDPSVVADAAVAVGDAALAAAAATDDEVDPETCALARRAWEAGASDDAEAGASEV